MQHQQARNHRLIGARSAPAEHVTLAPCPPDDCDRLTVDERGVYVFPESHDCVCDSYARVIHFERLSFLPGRTAYQREHDHQWAMHHRAILVRRGMNTPPAYVPPREPDAQESREELAEIGFAAWELAA